MAISWILTNNTDNIVHINDLKVSIPPNTTVDIAVSYTHLTLPTIYSV